MATPKPAKRGVQVEKIPQALRDYAYWCVWKYETREGEEKPTKVLYNPKTKGKGQSNNSKTFTPFDVAVALYQGGGYDGLGLGVFGSIAAVDIDHCISDGKYSDMAKEILEAMDCYSEVSPSGTGLRIIFSAPGFVYDKAKYYIHNRDIGLEIYIAGCTMKFVTITGNAINENTVEERGGVIPAILEKYMQRPVAPTRKKGEAPTPALSDDEVIAKATSAENADNFKRLWNGDTGAHKGDHSAADLALCNALAFWTGRNSDAMDRLFRKSGLMREKWNVKHGADTYGNMTIKKAIDTCAQVYQPQSGNYIVRDGCVFRKSGQNEKYLANFTAYPLETVIKDNGADEPANYFMIGGKTSDGIPLDPVSVPAGQFSSMSWVTQNWGLEPRIAPGNGNKDYFQDYIRSQAKGTSRKTVYVHTGFRKINGKLCYLYHGGAIGADNVQCELEGGLSRYAFVDPRDVTERDALTEVLNLFELAPPEVSCPLLAFTYLAPLCYFLEWAGITPEFALFLVGETGSFKTATSRLYLAHFQEYGGMSGAAPANFSSTSNAIEKMGFDLKDMLLLVDDYHPSNAADKKRMAAIAQRLARGAGDLSSRSRLNSDGTLKASYVPRGLSVVTGEDHPDIGQSGLARYYFVDFDKGKISTEALTQRQENAHLLNIAMQRYIKWLICNADEVLTEVKEQYHISLRMSNIDGSHKRTSAIISWLQVGIWAFVQYASEVGVMDEAAAREFYDNARAVFLEGGEKQTRTQREETPIRKFLSVLEELLASRKRTIESIDALVSDFGDAAAADSRIGYCDQEYYYLLPNAVYNAVSGVLRDGGSDFPVSKARLFADLVKAGLAQSQGERNTVKKRIRDTNIRYLALKKSAFYGREGDNENE